MGLAAVAAIESHTPPALELTELRHPRRSRWKSRRNRRSRTGPPEAATTRGCAPATPTISGSTAAPTWSRFIPPGTTDDTPSPTGPWCAPPAAPGRRWGLLAGRLVSLGVAGAGGRCVRSVLHADLRRLPVPLRPLYRAVQQGLPPAGEFDKLGTSCSHGCIRLQVADAKWIYDNKYDIAGGTIYDSDDPGPLGKPSAPLHRRQRLSRLGSHRPRQRQSMEQADGCGTRTETRTGA